MFETVPIEHKNYAPVETPLPEVFIPQLCCSNFSFCGRIEVTRKGPVALFNVWNKKRHICIPVFFSGIGYEFI
jgi:hypothetical protein